MNMRIAVDSNIFTMQRYGGVSRYFVRLGEEMTAMGHDFRIHGIYHINGYLTESACKMTSMRRIGSFPRYTRRIASSVSDFIMNAKLPFEPPDVIHETYYKPAHFPNPNIPHVCTIYDMIHELYPGRRGDGDKTRESKMETVNRSDAVICISETTREDLIRISGIRPEKTHVIHLGYDSMAGEPVLSASELASMASIKASPYLLYVGSRQSYKNFLGFLEGFSKSGMRGQVRIVAFGGGPITLRELGVASELGIAETAIIQLGGTDSLLKALYQNAEAFVFPSLYEGFGLPPLEAMSAGCPVIASNRSCIPEIVGDAAEYFEPDDPESIACAIDNVLNSHALRSALIVGGYDRITKFSWRKCAGETLKIYETLQ